MVSYVDSNSSKYTNRGPNNRRAIDAAYTTDAGRTWNDGFAGFAGLPILRISTGGAHAPYWHRGNS
jgi:hypothetical protein